MFQNLPTLKNLTNQQRITNVFADVPNNANYGGSEFLWNELLYRYGNFLVYSPDTAKSAVERMFIINAWKYRTLLGTEIDVDPLTDYDITTSKNGTKNNTLTGEKTSIKNGDISETVSDTLTLNTSVNDTGSLQKQKNTTVTETSGSTLTLDTTTAETGTKTNNLKKTESTENDSYTDVKNVSVNVYDDLSLKPERSETLTHTQAETPKTVETVDTGTVQDTGETKRTGTETTDGSKTTSNTGTDTDTSNNTRRTTGTESTDRTKTTSYNDFETADTYKDTDNGTFSENLSTIGYKSNPFELLDKARLTALFSVIDVILKDTKNLILYL